MAESSLPYHGVDPHAPNLASQIESAIRSFLQGDDVTHHIYALIDGAMDDRFGLELFQASRAPDAQVVSVYAGSPLEGAEECAPFLWSIERPQLPELLARCNGMPMLSFVQTPFGVEALQRHLAGFSRLQTPDGMRLILRLADAICFRDIVAAMGEPFTTELRAGFAAWHVIGRDGNVYSWAGMAVPGHPPALRTEPWPMSDKAYVQILDSSEADGLLCNLVRKSPALARTQSACELHRRITALLAILNTHQVTAAPERTRWVREALGEADEATAVAWLREQTRKD